MHHIPSHDTTLHSFPIEWHTLSLVELERKRQALWQKHKVYKNEYQTLYAHMRKIEAMLAQMEANAFQLEAFMYTRDLASMEDAKVALMLICEHLEAMQGVERVKGLMRRVVGRVGMLVKQGN